VRSKSRYVLLNKEIRPEVLLRSFEDLVFTLKSGDGSAAKWWSQVVNHHFVFLQCPDDSCDKHPQQQLNALQFRIECPSSLLLRVNQAESESAASTNILFSDLATVSWRGYSLIVSCSIIS
jgi:hypothetical protein